jgi:periplasmic divalent cation tolerance protein
MDTAHDIVVIFCTIPAGESEAMARALVERRLVACVNVVPVHSYYQWNGEFCSEPEHLLIAKTKKSMEEEVIIAIKELHSYDVPEIIAVPVVAGYAPYLAWVHAETKDNV